MSKKVKLDVNDVAVLNNELHTLQSEKDLSFAVKYDLVKLFEKTKEIVKRYQDQRNDLIEKYGEEKTEGKKDFALEKGTEKADKGWLEMEALMAKEETLAAEFAWKDFSELKSDNPYIQIMKFLDKPK